MVVLKKDVNMGEDRRSEFKLGVGVDNSPNQYNNPMGYELGNELAHTHSLIYSRSFTLTLVYKYKVKFTTNRILIKVF